MNDNVVKLDTKQAPSGKVFVCSACGRTSPHRYGGPGADAGWDSSCASNSVLLVESSLTRDENDRVIAGDCDSGYGVSLVGVIGMIHRAGDRY